MKIPVIFDIEIDGECSEKKAKEVFEKEFAPEVSIFLSENIEEDANDDYAIIINGWKFKDLTQGRSLVKDDDNEHHD